MNSKVVRGMREAVEFARGKLSLTREPEVFSDDGTKISSDKNLKDDSLAFENKNGKNGNNIS